MTDESLLPDQRRPHLRELQQRELELMRAIVNDPTWLAPHDESALRWALSLARLSAVSVRPDEGDSVTVDLGQATDPLRARLHGMIEQCFVDNKLSRDGLRAQLPHIRTLARDERREILRLFSDRLPDKALDRATRRRPLALVMGGGGGTGYVFIGAMSLLDEAGLVPSLIAGTSMGALLGAFRARSKQFSLGNVRQLLQRLSWRKVFRLFDTESRFGLPAALKLSLREVIGHEFLVPGDEHTSKKRFLRLNELAIPLRVTLAGLLHGGASSVEQTVEQAEELRDVFKDVSSISSLKRGSARIVRLLSDISKRPVKGVYLGGDELTRDFDVLDAIGFSSSVPGLIHYDVLRDDPRMVDLIKELMRRRGVGRFVDGGIVDNLPAKEAWRAIQGGAIGERDPFVLSLDAFAPQLTTRHLMFLPLMRMAAENSKAGRQQSHLTITFKDVLSPLSVVPSPSEFLRAVENGKREMAPHVPLIRKMTGPIPDPPGILNELT